MRKSMQQRIRVPISQTGSAVPTRGHDEMPTGAERRSRNKAFVATQRRNFLAGKRIPDSTCVIPACGDYRGIVRAEFSSQYFTLVGRQGGTQRAVAPPYSCRLIAACSHE